PALNSEGVVGVTTLKPCDRDKVLAAALPAGKKSDKNDRLYLDEPKRTACLFLDDHAFLLGSSEALKAHLDRPAADKDTAFGAACRAAADKHTAAAAVDFSKLARAIGGPGDLPAEMKPFKPLLKAKLAVGWLDVADKVKGGVRLTFERDDDAREAEKALKAALAMAGPALAEGRKLLEKQEGGGPAAALASNLQAALADATVQRDGATVAAPAAAVCDPKVAPDALAWQTTYLHKAAIREASANNLRQLAIGMINFADNNKGTLPAQAIYSKDGKPLLSWRVAILP